MCTLVCEGIEFLQQQRVNIIFLSQKSFPYRSLHERIYWNPFLVRVLLISTKHEAQDISLYMQMWRPSKATLESSTSPTSFSLIGVNYPSSLPKALPSAMRCIRGLPNTITCQWIPTGLFGASFYTFARVSITTTILPLLVFMSNQTKQEDELQSYSTQSRTTFVY